MNSFLIVKFQFLKESSQLLLVQSLQVLTGVDKDHSPNSVSLVKCVFHEIPRVIIKLFVLFFKDKLFLYLMFCRIGTHC